MTDIGGELLLAGTGEVITTIADASAKDVDAAVQAAKKSFYTTWGTKTAASERGRLLNKLADLVERDADQLAAIEARDAGALKCSLCSSHTQNPDLTSISTGKFFPHARHMDIPNVIATLRYYAGWADKSTGDTIEVRSSITSALAHLRFRGTYRPTKESSRTLAMSQLVLS